MKFLEILTELQDIYYGFTDQKNFWGKNMTPVNMTNYGRCNVRKHREIKNGEQNNILEISYNLEYMEQRKVTSSYSNDYMERSDKVHTTSLKLRTKTSNKNQKARFAITEIINKDYREFLKKFNNSPYLG